MNEQLNKNININEKINKRKKILEWIELNNLSELKSYVQENDVKLVDLNDKNVDIFVEAIKRDASIDIIQFIINMWYQYLKPEIYCYKKKDDNKYVLPLSTAIEKNKFKMADYLINLGMDINDIPFDDFKRIITPKNSNYIISKNFIVKEGLILKLIKENKFYFLKILFSNYIYNNTFIINLLIHSKRDIPLSTQQLKNFMDKEHSKIIINQDIYKSILKKIKIDEKKSEIKNTNNNNKKNENNLLYQLVYLFYMNDFRDKDVKSFEFYKIIRSQEINYVNEFIEKNKDNTINKVKGLIKRDRKSVV